MIGRINHDLIKHNCRVKIYPNGKVHLTCFSRNIFVEDGYVPAFEDESEQGSNGYKFVIHDDGTFELIKEDKEKREYNTDNPRDDNMRRAKGKIFDIALSNEWSYMVTLTLDAGKIDRYNPKEIIRPFSKWLNNMVSRKGLNYLIVPELHEDGAIHFHGLINDTLDFVDSGTVKVPDRKKPIKISTAKSYGYDLAHPDVRTVYNIKNYHLGFSTAVKIDNNVEAVSKYMTKYTCKNFQKIFGQSFFAGGNINRELPSYLIDLKYQYIDGEEFFLPENLGSVKYLLVDENIFDLLLKDWSKY